MYHIHKCDRKYILTQLKYYNSIVVCTEKENIYIYIQNIYCKGKLVFIAVKITYISVMHFCRPLMF